MTILEALERAKQMQQERRAAEGPRQQQGRRRQPGVVRRTAQETDLVSAAQLEVPQLTPDTKTCDQNHILIGLYQGRSESAAMDAYRILRTRLAQNGAGVENWTTFGIVSAGPGEGKSMTVLNLALAFAREKQRNVFLLDLDLRNPSICRYLGVTPPVGIGEVLLGEAQPASCFFGVGIPNLIIAGGLMSHENSSELLGGAGARALFEHIAESHPGAIVLVDLPPVLMAADALVIASRLAAMVMVVSEGMTRREHLDRAMEVLNDATVAGVVLNRSREAAEDYYS